MRSRRTSASHSRSAGCCRCLGGRGDGGLRSDGSDCGRSAGKYPPLRLDPIGVRSRVLLAGLVPRLRLQEGYAHRARPKGIVHDGVAGHARHPLQNERDI